MNDEEILNVYKKLNMPIYQFHPSQFHIVYHEDMKKEELLDVLYLIAKELEYRQQIEKDYRHWDLQYTQYKEAIKKGPSHFHWLQVILVLIIIALLYWNALVGLAFGFLVYCVYFGTIITVNKEYKKYSSLSTQIEAIDEIMVNAIQESDQDHQHVLDIIKELKIHNKEAACFYYLYQEYSRSEKELLTIYHHYYQNPPDYQKRVINYRFEKRDKDNPFSLSEGTLYTNQNDKKDNTL